MNRRAPCFSALLLAIVVGCAEQSTTEPVDVTTDTATVEATTPVGLGSPAPMWTNLPGADGQEHSLADLNDAPIVVLAVTCNSCPVAVAYEERFNEFAREFADRGVRFVALHAHQSESLDDIKQRATEKDFAFPYLYDDSQEVARAYGATVTPHLFVLNEDRQIAYMGAFDDNLELESVTQRYVHDAVEAILAGESPSPSVTKQFGCGIKWK